MNAEELKEKLWKLNKKDLQDRLIISGNISCIGVQCAIRHFNRLELVYAICKQELGYNVGRK